MVGSLVRKGGSVLAVLAVVAGGAFAGAGSAGSVALGSAAPPCSVDDSMPGCYDSWFEDVKKVGDILLGYRGPKAVALGQETSFVAVFNAGDGSYQDSIPDVAIASVTHHPPKGFEFMGVDVSTATLDSTAVVDPVTGDLTVTAPAGGWAVPKHQASNGHWDSGYVEVVFTYKVTKLVLDGTSGLRFTGTDVPASDGWMVTGTTKVTPVDLGGFGSSN
jgi:hypothetical protein